MLHPFWTPSLYITKIANLKNTHLKHRFLPSVCFTNAEITPFASLREEDTILSIKGLTKSVHSQN